MEDFFSIVIVLLIYAAVIGSVRKKSAKRRNNKEKCAARKPQFEAAFEETARKKEAGAGQVSMEDVRQALARAARSAAPQPEASRQEQDCQTSRLHLHDVAQEEMDGAGEGEDPCHGGYAPEPTPAPGFLDAQEWETQTLSQDVLRGVIMSEILTRPCERRKRSTYGR